MSSINLFDKVMDDYNFVDRYLAQMTTGNRDKKGQYFCYAFGTRGSLGIRKVLEYNQFPEQLTFMKLGDLDGLAAAICSKVKLMLNMPWTYFFNADISQYPKYQQLQVIAEHRIWNWWEYNRIANQLTRNWLLHCRDVYAEYAQPAVAEILSTDYDALSQSTTNGGEIPPVIVDNASQIYNWDGEDEGQGIDEEFI